MRSLSVPVALVVASALLCACASPIATAERPTAAAMMSSSLPPESPTPVPTLEPTPTVPADAEAETGLAGGDSVPIGPGTVVKTIADDGLRLRSDPSVGDDSAKCEPLLPLGTPLMILDGPVSGSGYEWYEVAPLTPTACSGGWVASASRENEPWIEPAGFDC